MPESLFNKVAGQPPTILKKRLWHRCFPVNFVKFLWTPFLKNSNNSNRATTSAHDTVNYKQYTKLVDSPKVLSGLPRFHLSIRIFLLIVGVLSKEALTVKLLCTTLSSHSMVFLRRLCFIFNLLSFSGHFLFIYGGSFDQQPFPYNFFDSNSK